MTIVNDDVNSELLHLRWRTMINELSNKFICYHLRKMLDFQYWLDNLKETQLMSQCNSDETARSCDMPYCSPNSMAERLAGKPHQEMFYGFTPEECFKHIIINNQVN
ncbi:hypothetical protein SDB36_12790 [Legionella pneumophila serogroup 1]